MCSFVDDDDCRATFVYGYHNETGRLMVWVQKTKECPVVVDIMSEEKKMNSEIEKAVSIELSFKASSWE